MKEPAFNKITDKQKMAFRRSFIKDPDTFQVGNVDIPAAELHSKRSELRKMAKSTIDMSEKENRAMNDNEKDAVDVCIALLSDINDSFEKKEERAHVTTKIMGVTGVIHRSDSLELWEDAETGKKIPVLSKENRFQDFYPQHPDHGISARDFFAGVAGHRQSSEIRAAMATNFDGKGGYMVPETVAAEVIDLLRSKNVVIQAGAKSIPLPSPSVRVCRITSDPVASWTAENAQIPEDNSMTIGALEFHAKKLTCLIKASRELLQDASNAGNVIMNAIATAMALELDSAALLGDGVQKPLGIANAEGINTYSLGDNGSTLHGFDDILYGVREIVNVNGPIPKTAIMAPRTLVGYSILKDGNGLPLVRPELIKGMQFLDTTKISTDQVQGTSGTVCSSIILGSFEHFVIGIRAHLEIQVLQERYADQGQVGFIATMRADTATYQPKAFCKIIGIKP